MSLIFLISFILCVVTIILSHLLHTRDNISDERRSFFRNFKIGSGVGATIFLLLLTGSFILTNNSSSSIKTQAVHASAASKTSPTPTVATLSSSQRAQVVVILTENVTQFIKIWQDGQASLETPQYADPYVEMSALSNPNSPAAKFNYFVKNEYPTNNNSYIQAAGSADKVFPSTVSTVSVANWSNDMGHLSNDIEQWVSDAKQWQISQVPRSALNNDADKVVNDFNTVEKDIKNIQ